MPDITDQTLNLFVIQTLPEGRHIVFAVVNNLSQIGGRFVLNFLGAQVLDLKSLPQLRSSAIVTVAQRAVRFE